MGQINETSVGTLFEDPKKVFAELFGEFVWVRDQKLVERLRNEVDRVTGVDGFPDFMRGRPLGVITACIGWHSVEP